MNPSRFHPLRSSLATPVAATLGVLALMAGPADAFRWPWKGDPWPGSSDHAVTPLDHPAVESVLAGRPAGTPYRFAVFGDQRALADGEWQAMIRRIAGFRGEDAVLFLVDTGDIVADGSHTDQFRMLREILRPVGDLPYLVAVGNHEVSDNDDPQARVDASTFLAYLDADLGPDRLYYRKEIGPATFLFLDTNDFTYGPDGERKACPLAIRPDTREGGQLRWIRKQVEELKDRDRLVVAVMHHPIVQSSEKHSAAACALWNFSDGGDGLADLLADAGTDIVLTGHTHTYERFRMVRDDGRAMAVINVSGRPRDAFLWKGSGDRRARDIRGREHARLEEVGWRKLHRWTITQEDVMLKDDEADQFAVFEVRADGAVRMRVHFVEGDDPGEDRITEWVRLH